MGVITSVDDAILRDMAAYRSTPLQEFFATAMARVGVPLREMSFFFHGRPEESYREMQIHATDFRFYASEKEVPVIPEDVSQETFGEAFAKRSEFLDKFKTAPPAPGLFYERKVPVVGILWDPERHKDEHVRFRIGLGELDEAGAIAMEQTNFVNRTMTYCPVTSDLQYHFIPVNAMEKSVDGSAFQRFRADAMAAQPYSETVNLSVRGMRLQLRFSRSRPSTFKTLKADEVSKGAVTLESRLDWLPGDEYLSRTWEHGTAQEVVAHATTILDAYLKR